MGRYLFGGYFPATTGTEEYVYRTYFQLYGTGGAKENIKLASAITQAQSSSSLITTAVTGTSTLTRSISLSSEINLEDF
jgi:hypothetical protein